MSSAFISGMFGSDVSSLYPKAVVDLRRNLENKQHPPGTKIYVFGRNNLELVKDLGSDAVMLDEQPLHNWLGLPLDPQPCGQIFHGLRMWIHKLDIIYHALSDYDEVTWIDFDVLPNQDIPADYWDRMRQDKPFQMGMCRLRQPICYWRQDSVFSPLGIHYRPHGGFIYCRDRQIIWELMSICLAIPKLDDEEAAALWCDMKIGPVNSQSIQRWKDEGYEPYCYRHRAQVFAPEKVVFYHKRIG